MAFSWTHLAIIIFFAAGISFAAIPLIASRLLAHRSETEALFQPYECGLPTYGSAWVRFGINYYFYALIFLAFDVDVLYLFPVALFYREAQGIAPFVEILIFVLVLLAAIVYFQRKGVFTWPGRIKI
ncbi:MAG: NADH-quinone oxidoreductase subunit A [Desulfonatronovibrionaceae bacterium]